MRRSRLALGLLAAVCLVPLVGCVAAPAPVIGPAIGGDARATVSWSPPPGDTGAEVQSYVVTPYVGSSVQAPTTVGANDTSTVITGLTNGTTYSFSVRANLPSGETASSARSNPVTPVLPGAAYGWGQNSSFQLGAGSNAPRTTPTQIGAIHDWVAVDGGVGHTVALRADGTLWAWGVNELGQLGDGTTSLGWGPTQIGTHTGWAMISAGWNHTLAIRADGTLWAWGDNQYGQLGDGTITNRLSPVQVGTGTDWATLSGSSGHSVAIRADGTLWAWGFNWEGQLGDGTTTNRLSPVQVGSATDWASVATADLGTVAVKSNGTLWRWGYTGFCCPEVEEPPPGEPSSPPTQIGSATDWASVAAGSLHYLAFKTDGTLWTWGAGWRGQLGLSGSSNQSEPAQVAGTDWEAGAAGFVHTVARKTDGTLWAWGGNSYGTVGDGTTTDRTAPTLIGAGTDWATVATGFDHTLALTEP